MIASGLQLHFFAFITRMRKITRVRKQLPVMPYLQRPDQNWGALDQRIAPLRPVNAPRGLKQE